MHVTRHRDFDSLASHLAVWNELARGVPFRRWDWQEAWWRNYGCSANGRPRRNHELLVLCVWDETESLVGIAPWYRVRSRSGARVIHFLGDGEVCSDYLSILCRQNAEEAVAAALADWLIKANHRAGRGEPAVIGESDDVGAADDVAWDRLEIIGVDAADEPVNCLLNKLQACGHVAHPPRALNTWRLQLPATWEDLLMSLSKQHRNRLRKADREYFQSGRLTVRRVATQEEFERFFDILLDLHGRRWRHKGLPGAFASPKFAAFHREIAARWWIQDLATLSWFELDEKPLAVEYRLHGDGIMYAYQSGMDTDRLELRPGELANMAAIRSAIEHEQTGYDFLRGDEEYKSRWRAKPRPMLVLRVAPPHASAQLRHAVWLAGQNVKRWLKHSAKFVQHWKSQSEAAERPQPVGETT